MAVIASCKENMETFSMGRILGASENSVWNDGNDFSLINFVYTIENPSRMLNAVPFVGFS